MAAKPSEQAPSDGSAGSERPGPRPEQPVDEPSPLPPFPVLSPLLARRLNARVLDPEAAYLAPGQPLPLPTVYVSDTLLVRDVSDPSLDGEGQLTRVQELQELARQVGADSFSVQSIGSPTTLPLPRSVAEALSPEAEVTVTRVRLERQGDQAGKSPDAWRFLQTALTSTSDRAAILYDKLGLGRLPDPDGEESPEEQARRRRRDTRGRSMASGVTVEHVLTAGGGVWGGGGGVWGGGGGVWGGGGGVWGGGGGVWGGGGLLAEYGAPGVGGRTPVVWSAPDPRLAVRAGLPDEPPVVAILDTGLGEHSWFPPEGEKATVDDCPGGAACPGVHRRVVHAGREVGVWKEPSRDPENTGVIIDEVNGLMDVLCGHGTFIAGIVRQRCPEAVILAVPIMASDGAALEEDVIDALTLLLARHKAAKDDPSIRHGRLDVLNLSLGYYHETPDEADDTALHDLLREFGREGVVVVACAGNDATRARFFPAAFATTADTALVGVGATNPDDRSVALFSNVGDWVTAHAPGAGIVSTVPRTLSGSGQAGVSVKGVGPGPRSSIDFDDFRSGFAVWSGTSFAAPWVAGDIAREIVRPSPEDDRATVAPGAGRAKAAAATVVAKANRERFPKRRTKEE
ncbi:S8 family serine peptidase [Oryzobacter sp. R7]|uniref:S8 family serine peptidase n=1 Tax=Oryzobacter faecalis TaxID=3388656 RepID=UPI00398CD68B